MTIDITPEAIERLINMRGFREVYKIDDTLRALSAALTESKAEAAAAYDVVKVKPLVWSIVEVDRGDGSSDATGGHQAESSFGLYVIDLGWGSDCYYWSTQSPEGDDLGSDFEDLDQAKDAAQADYAARIMDAIATPADSKAALERMLAEARAETAAAWQPIETAPNIRGVRIIGWCVFPAGAEAREVKGYIPLDRMEDAVQWFYGSVLQNVTHWMPLPPPPKGTPHE